MGRFGGGLSPGVAPGGGLGAAVVVGTDHHQGLGVQAAQLTGHRQQIARIKGHGHRVAGGASAAYDEATVRACAAFQRAQGWTGADADGIAGPQTVDRLGLVWVDD